MIIESGLAASNNIYQQVNGNNSSDNSASGFKKSIKLEAERMIDLGKVNNKPVKMRIFSHGGYEWSGSPHIHAPNFAGEKISLKDQAVARVHDSYNKTERTQANAITSTVNDFYFMTKRGYSVKFFNDSMQGRGTDIKQVKETVRLLGFNPEESFTINGRTFQLKDNQLMELENKPVTESDTTPIGEALSTAKEDDFILRDMAKKGYLVDFFKQIIKDRSYDNKEIENLMRQLEYTGFDRSV